MKQLLILFLLISGVSYGQKPWGGVHVRSVNPCTGEEDPDFFWKLKTADGKLVFEANPLKRGKQIAEIYEEGDYYIYEDFGLASVAVGKIHVTLNDTIYLHTVYQAKLQRNNCVCSPPDPNYYYCGEIANGIVLDYYNTGNLRAKGTFENGLPSDTLWQYTIDGVLTTRISPEGDGKYHREEFDAAGKISYDYSQKERYIKTYTDSTVEHMFWDEKSRYRHEDYLHGHLVRTTNDKEDFRYDSTGMITAFAERKEIDKWRRIFALNSFDRHFKYYEYSWNIYLGNQRRGIIKFWSDQDFESGRQFPGSVSEISADDVQHIYFYEGSQLVEHYTNKYTRGTEEKAHRHNEFTLVQTLTTAEFQQLLDENF